MLRGLIFPAAASLLLGACASHLSYGEMQALMPPQAPDKGRIYVYREDAWLGNLITPDVVLDDKTVGVSNPGAYFFVDRAPGTYQVLCGKGDHSSASITVAAGQQVYVRTAPAPSVVKAEMITEVVPNQAAIPAIANLKYVASAAAQ
jgi:hypothetical protein